MLTRVEKAARVTYGYQIIPDNNYHQFPDLTMPFELQFGQYVQIRYNVVLTSQGANYFICRVVVDGV